MVTTHGNASRAITGGAGLDIPLEPPAVSAQLAQLRRQRQIAAIEAAEAAAARAAAQAPLPRRRRTAAPPPPPRAPRPVEAPELDIPEATAPIPEPVADPEPAPAQESVPDLGVGESLLVRQLRAELAMAGTRITQLLTQVEDQGACITQAVSDVQTTTELVARLCAENAEHQDALTERATTAERALQAANLRIQALLGAAATAHRAPAPPANPAAAADVVHQAEPVRRATADPVRCAGGCGVPVAAQYVERFGTPWHGSCADRVPAGIRLAAGRRAAA